MPSATSATQSLPTGHEPVSSWRLPRHRAPRSDEMRVGHGGRLVIGVECLDSARR